MNTSVNEYDKFGKGTAQELQDPALATALQNFRASVHAWSDAAYAAPRALPVAPPRRVLWRKATAWACGSVLALGLASGGVYEKHHRAQLAQQAEARRLQQERLAAEARAKETEQLLAQIDSDISREVPAAMDPLARLMTDGDGK